MHRDIIWAPEVPKSAREGCIIWGVYYILFGQIFKLKRAPQKAHFYTVSAFSTFLTFWFRLVHNFFVTSHVYQNVLFFDRNFCLLDFSLKCGRGGSLLHFGGYVICGGIFFGGF